MTHPRLLALVLLSALAAAACGSRSDAEATTPEDDSPTTSAPAPDEPDMEPEPEPEASPPAPDAALAPLTAEGRLYSGPIMGGRGGAYSIRLCPDGSYRYVLLDAAVQGTYTRDGDTLHLTQPDGTVSEMRFTNDERALDANEMTYRGPDPCVR